jgi:anti-anti-sigma factor
VILGLSGKLDATTVKTFEDKILAEIDSGDRRFVIDLSQLDYVSSSGLRVFLLAAKRLRSRDGKIAFCSLKDHVQQVFDLSGFSSILFFPFTVHETMGSKVCNVWYSPYVSTRRYYRSGSVFIVGWIGGAQKYATRAASRFGITDNFVGATTLAPRSAAVCACLRRTPQSSFD